MSMTAGGRTDRKGKPAGIDKPQKIVYAVILTKPVNKDLRLKET
jgi:hypothetical protein